MDENDVAALRGALADHLRAEARYRLTGPLKDAADYGSCLPLDNGLLVDMTASETRHGADGIDTFDLGLGWLLVSRYDPRTTSIEELIRGIIEANVGDEAAELDAVADEDEP